MKKHMILFLTVIMVASTGCMHKIIPPPVIEPEATTDETSAKSAVADASVEAPVKSAVIPADITPSTYVAFLKTLKNPEYRYVELEYVVVLENKRADIFYKMWYAGDEIKMEMITPRIGTKTIYYNSGYVYYLDNTTREGLKSKEDLWNPTKGIYTADIDEKAITAMRLETYNKKPVLYMEYTAVSNTGTNDFVKAWIDFEKGYPSPVRVEFDTSAGYSGLIQAKKDSTEPFDPSILALPSDVKFKLQ